MCLTSDYQDFSLYNATYRGGVNAEVAAELGCKADVDGKSFTSLGCNKDSLKECLPDSCYQESMLLEYATKLINYHDPSTPLFLTYASKLVHPPLETTRSAVDLEDKLQKFFSDVGVEHRYNWTKCRRRMSASLLYLDFVCARLAQALKDRNMY